MIKILFSKHDFAVISIAGILCGILLTFIEVPGDTNINLEDAFLYARDGYIYLSDRCYSSDIFNCTFNLLIFIPLITKVFIKDYDTAKSFLFVRVKDVTDWYKYKILQSVIYCFFSSLIYNLTLLIILILRHFRADSPMLVIKYIALGILAGFLILFLIVSAGNTLSLIIKPHLSTAITMCITVIIMGIACVLNDGQIQFNILINYFISWHMIMNSNSVFYYYPTWTYYGAVCIFIVIELVAGKHILKKSDYI